MSHISADLATRVATRHGLVTNDELAADGLSIHNVRRLITDGVLVRCHQGVVRFATSPSTFESRCAAASLADPSIVITGPAAARLWEFRHVWRPDHPIVLAPHGSRPLPVVW